MPWGFVQAVLYVQTSAVCIAVLWFGQTNFYLAFCCQLQLYIFNWAAVPVWTLKNTAQQQSLYVVGKGNGHLTGS